jgi:hypothetical protein
MNTTVGSGELEVSELGTLQPPDVVEVTPHLPLPTR